MKRFEVKAKREMQCGERTLQPGDVVCRVEYEDDVPPEFVAHAMGGDLVTCERWKAESGKQKTETVENGVEHADPNM